MQPADQRAPVLNLIGEIKKTGCRGAPWHEWGLRYPGAGQHQAIEQPIFVFITADRHLLYGRNYKYNSENPYLSGEAVIAFIDGVQSQSEGTALSILPLTTREKGA
jgi:hypothetical protein